uniref:C-type lectin domain-containing protein n=1 Tax=Panagrolaimus sp. ES5 TaxID=591445 RepID=A0AC34FWZ6_9BILA
MNGLIFSFLILYIFFVFGNTKCPEGTSQSLSDNTTCFSFVWKKQPFVIAEEICIQNGGHLTSIHDGFDNVLIRETAQQNFTDSVSSDFWIGLNNLETSAFSWIDGTPIDFVDWGKGQPNNSPGNSCGSVNLSEGQWISDNCDKPKPFVCVIKTFSFTSTTALETTTIKAKQCPNSWIYYDHTGFCYCVFNKTSNWGDAEDWCFSQGGHLASIHSLAENSFVTNLIPFDPNDHSCDYGNFVYIGLYTLTDQATWRWTDDSPYDYSGWAPGRPAHKNARCGMILNGPPCGFPVESWAEYFCGDIVTHFICKKSLN